MCFVNKINPLNVDIELGFSSNGFIGKFLNVDDRYWKFACSACTSCALDSGNKIFSWIDFADFQSSLTKLARRLLKKFKPVHYEIKLCRIILSLVVIGQIFYAVVGKSSLAAPLRVPNDTTFVAAVKHLFYFELGKYLLIAHDVFLNCSYAAFMRVFDVSKAITQNKHKPFWREQRG